MSEWQSLASRKFHEKSSVDSKFLKENKHTTLL
jgi:hypothetical protein